MTKGTAIIDGKAIAEQWLRDTAVQVQALGTSLHLASVHVGEDDGLAAFVRLKQKAAQRCGIQFSSYVAKADEQDRMHELLVWLAKDEGVNGIFVELPLPATWDERAILGLVPEGKDVDVISPAGEQRFYENGAGSVPPAVGALDRAMQVHDVERGGTAVVVGQGKLVGRPCAHWLGRQGFRVLVVDVNTEHPERIARTGDVLVCGAGVPGLVNGEWVREGAAVFDFGYAKQGEGYAGDVDWSSVAERAGLITPVPGGMGPLVVAATMENVLSLSVAGA